MTNQEWNPGQILELSGSYWKTCTLHAGVKLGVFTAIGKGKSTPKVLADNLKADERALTMLLHALVAMELCPTTRGSFPTRLPAWPSCPKIRLIISVS